MKWMTTWIACFESLSANRAESIEAYVSTKCEGLKDGEFERAVNLLAENWNPKEQGKAPGIGLLIATIRGQRKRDRGINIDEPYEYTQAKRLLRSMRSDTIDRWDLICSMCELGSGNHWARELEKYAESNGGFVVPWWVDGGQHSMALRQLPHPAGVTCWWDAVVKAGQARMMRAG